MAVVAGRLTTLSEDWNVLRCRHRSEVTVNEDQKDSPRERCGSESYVPG
jgi:hypothetical protein